MRNQRENCFSFACICALTTPPVDDFTRIFFSGRWQPKTTIVLHLDTHRIKTNQRSLKGQGQSRSYVRHLRVFIENVNLSFSNQSTLQWDSYWHITYLGFYSVFSRRSSKGRKRVNQDHIEVTLSDHSHVQDRPYRNFLLQRIDVNRTVNLLLNTTIHFMSLTQYYTVCPKK